MISGLSGVTDIDSLQPKQQGHEVQVHVKHQHKTVSNGRVQDLGSMSHVVSQHIHMITPSPQPFESSKKVSFTTPRSLSLSSDHGDQQGDHLGQQRDETTLSHDQVGVLSRVGSFWASSDEPQRVHSGRVESPGPREPHCGRTHQRDQGSARCDDHHQPGQVGPAQGDVPRAWHSTVGESPCGRPSSPPQAVDHSERHSLDHLPLRGSLQRNVLRGDCSHLTGLHQVGHRGGGPEREPRVAASPVGALGDQNGCQRGSDQPRACTDAEREVPGRDEPVREPHQENSSGRTEQPSEERQEQELSGVQRFGHQGDERNSAAIGQEHDRDARGDARGPSQVPQCGIDRGICESGESEVRSLTHAKAQALHECGKCIIPDAWEALISNGQDQKLFLVEIACSQDSALSEEVQKQGLTAARLSIWNDHDLSTGEGVRRCVKFIEKHRPRYVWISTECGAFSPMQNCNQRNPEQIETLKRKQNEARKQHIGGLVIADAARHLGCDVVWEWSRRCRAWKWEPMDKWRNRHQTQTAIIAGCQVNLKNPKTQKLLGKEWRLECTNHQLASAIHAPCQCGSGYQHAPCEGSMTRTTAFYTPEMVRRVVRHMKCLGNPENLKCWFGDEGHVYHTSRGSQPVSHTHDTEHDHEHDDMDTRHPQEPKHAAKCECRMIKNWNRELTCFNCMKDQHGVIFMTEEQKHRPLTPEERRKAQRDISLIHASTGHGSKHVLVQALKSKKVHPEVLELANQFRCSSCEERKRPDPRLQATLNVNVARWRSVQMDAGFWRHPKTRQQIQFVVLLDEASRFMVTHLVKVEGKGVKATDYTKIFEEKWKPYFGIPDVVRLDPEGALRSHEIRQYFDQQGVFPDTIPAEAHWNLSHVERSIAWIKELLTKMSLDDELDIHSLLPHATYVWNQREQVRGYSPYQHALGRCPDSDGRVFSERLHDLPMELLQDPEGEVEVAQSLRNQAEKVFIDWQLQEKLTRARNSKHRTPKTILPGDLVFYWRVQNSNSDKLNSWTRGNYVGPARVLATETKRDEDNNLHPTSVIWLVRGTKLVKVAAEQIRPASVREQCLHEINSPPRLPWTFTNITQELKKGEYWDHTAKGPSAAKRSSVEPQEIEDHPTGRKRYSDKLPPHHHAPPDNMETDFDSDKDLLQEFPKWNTEGVNTDMPRLTRTARSRSPKKGGIQMFTGAPWVEEVEESFWTHTDSTVFWNDEKACVEVEFDMPHNQRSWKRFFRDSESYFISALKRRSIEVSERHLSQEEHEQFKGAKSIEVDRFIAAKALEAIPEGLRPNRQQALKMRWVLTWKKKDDGGVKPKARAVVLGYMDPDYANRPTFAPTMTRHSRQLFLQWAANNKALVQKGDVSAAFLQGREFARELFLIPTDEICEAMGLQRQSIVKMKKACYGLVEAPIEWFETMNDYLRSVGFTQLYSDPCFWKLTENGETIALISGHVDDFLFTGREDSQKWQDIKQGIKKRFQWQEWEQGDFVQCGVRIQEEKTGGYILDQVNYLEEVQEIQISRDRKRYPKEETTEKEKTELRGLLGALSWHTSQVGYRFSAYVSLYLSEVSRSTVQTLLDVNSLFHKMKSVSKEPMRIFPFDVSEQPEIFCWTDASSQNRHDGSSTKGIFIGMSGKRLEMGEVDRVSPWFWQSGKIDRVCRSPGSAEARAMVDGEDILYLLRFQWSEIMGHMPDLHDIDTHVAKVGGVMITDSRNAYDHLDKPYITPKGKERRVDLEMLTVKESQNRTGLKVRWVSSQAMLANTLTKKDEDIQMSKFIQLGQHWRIVHDVNMFSGKRRIRNGLNVLE